MDLFVNQPSVVATSTVARRIASYSGAKPTNTLGSFVSTSVAHKMHLATKEVKALRSKQGVQKFVR